MTTVNTTNVDLLVLGAGPGGYTAAFRAADLGMKTVIVERYGVLGGVCLNVGCVPSKALLHAASLVKGIHQFVEDGSIRNTVTIDPDKLRQWKESTVEQLNKGLAGLAKRRRIEVIKGDGRFLTSHELLVQNGTTETRILFRQAIVATGSHAVKLPFLPYDECIWNSTRALQIPMIPNDLLVIGGGVIGLEMATVYQRLGSQVTIVEMADSFLPGVDKGTVRPLYLEMRKMCTLYASSRVTGAKREVGRLRVSLEGSKCPTSVNVDAILVSVGRRANSTDIGLETVGVAVDSNACIKVDSLQRTSISHIFAIGDVTPGPMLAHRASAEGKLAAEVAAGVDVHRAITCIPHVAYTSPEVAVAGLSEASAQAAGIPTGIGKFPFAASARAMTLRETSGFVKLIFNRDTDILIGAEMVGPHVGELISAATLAIQNGLTVSQYTQTIHPHPSLSESVLMAAEVFEGTVTDLYIPHSKSNG